MKLIDWQCSYIASPVLDLSYCFYSGATGKHLDQLDYFLKVYHDSLTEVLKEFAVDAQQIYPLSTLKQEWKKFCKFGFHMATALWKAKLADPNKLPDFAVSSTELDRRDLWVVAADKKEVYRQIIRDLVFHFKKNDFFDI